MTIRHQQSTPPVPPPLPPEYPWPPERPGPSPSILPSAPSLDTEDWPRRLYDRLLEQRIVMAHGHLDDAAATRTAAQLLTLDAESSQPIRLELRGLDADLGAALNLMDVLDVLRVPVSAYAGGSIRGPALGVLAVADHRFGYPSAIFVLSEPRMQFEGTVTAVESQREQQANQLDNLIARLAETTGHDIDAVRSDFEGGRVLSIDEAIDYGLIQRRAEPRRPARTGLLPG